jgi:phosphohistidine phosphatase
MRLLLVRHAKAFERDPAKWQDDLLRPLTADGREEFAACAKRLRRIQESVDCILASPAVRAWQTAEILTERAGWPRPKRCDPLLPEPEAGAPAEGPATGPNVWTSLLASFGDDAVVAWVGHEPTLGRITSWLLTGDPGRANVRFRKGAVVAIDRERGMSSLAWMVTPRLLRSI